MAIKMWPQMLSHVLLSMTLTLRHYTMTTCQCSKRMLQTSKPTALLLQDCLQDIPVPGANCTILCDVSMPTPRPIVPESLRRLVFDTIHGLAHPGVKATQKLITERFVWHGINKNIALWVKPALKLSSQDGSPDLVFQKISPQIVGDNLSHTSGCISLPCLVFMLLIQQHTTNDLSSDFIDN